MLCYLYPPVQAVGATRSVEFSKILSCRLRVSVLTVSTPKDRYLTVGQEPPPSSVEVFRAPELNLSLVTDTLHPVLLRIFRLFGVELKRNYLREALCIPDAQIGWFCLPKLIKLCRDNDCLYVGCSPFSAAVFGAVASRLTGIRLVLDFRDAWTLNPHVSYSRYHLAIINRLERWVLKICDALILNSPGALELYRDKYRELESKFCSIPNGYDKIDLASPKSVTGKLTIMHVGSFYGERNPELLLEMLAELNDDRIEFVQVGGSFPWLEKFRSRVNLRHVPRVARKEAMELMKSAHILYLKQGYEPGVKSHVAIAAKTYEYISTGLPILAEVPPGDNGDLVESYAVHRVVVRNLDGGMLRRGLLELIEAKGWEAPQVSKRYVEEFSREKLAERLEGVLNGGFAA
jgi:glycosyltransferase involved in cell wall biosynthesis